MTVSEAWGIVASGVWGGVTTGTSTTVATASGLGLGATDSEVLCSVIISSAAFQYCSIAVGISFSKFFFRSPPSIKVLVASAVSINVSACFNA